MQRLFELNNKIKQLEELCTNKFITSERFKENVFKALLQVINRAYAPLSPYAKACDIHISGQLYDSSNSCTHLFYTHALK